MLLSPELLKKLAALTLRSNKRGSGVRVGERRSQRRGQSQEFADHRPYVPGDDLRFLDWHLYGRLDTLWVKLFEEEDDRVVQVLLDCSTSMEGEKLDYARQVAASLAFVALGHNDRVTVAGLTDAVASYAPPRRGRSASNIVFDTIEAVNPGGKSDPGKALASFPRQRGTGIALLFTDFLYPEGPDAALRNLVARGNEVHAFHIVAPAELRPAVDGDLVLVDAESGEELAISVDEATLDRYETTVHAWAEEMEITCRRLGVGYTRVLTSTPLEEFIFKDLRRVGVVGR
ncbi:MAG: DUF58 domain-containing protein [Alphaproteobacteria bacterium]|nr:DUF58 domain-containing protein [Alphaproteobacteria bacterium]